MSPLTSIERAATRPDAKTFFRAFTFWAEGDPNLRWVIHINQLENGWWDVFALDSHQDGGCVIGAFEKLPDAISAANVTALKLEHFEVFAALPWQVIQGGASENINETTGGEQ